MNSTIKRLRRIVARHERWALAQAMQFPFFSLFFIATLWVWSFLALPIILPLTVLMISGNGFIGLSAAFLSFIVATALLVLFAPWFFTTYFMCIALMFKGHSDRAKDRLQALNTLLSEDVL